MIDKLLSKIPVVYYRNIKNSLLYVATFLGFFGIVGIAESMATTREEKWLFITKVIDVPIEERISSFVLAISFIIISGVCLVLAWRITTSVKRFARYEIIIRELPIIELRQLADMTNTNSRKVAADLQNMLDAGYISNYYIDHQKNMLVNQNITIESQGKISIKCPQCGAMNEAIIGLKNLCEYCDSPLD